MKENLSVDIIFHHKSTLRENWDSVRKKESEEESMLRDNVKKILSGTGLQLCGDDLKMY